MTYGTEGMLYRGARVIGMYTEAVVREWHVIDVRRERNGFVEYLALANGAARWIRAGAFLPARRA